MKGPDPWGQYPGPEIPSGIKTAYGVVILAVPTVGLKPVMLSLVTVPIQPILMGLNLEHFEKSAATSMKPCLTNVSMTVCSPLANSIK